MKSYNFLLTVILIFISVDFLFSQTWIRKNEGFGFWSIEKDNLGNIYAGTSGTPRGIFKSTDGGETWTNVYLTGSTNYLEISFDSSNNVYVAASSAGVLKSTDGGATFTTIPASNFGGNSVNTVLGGPNGILFVGVTSGGIYRSTDFGNTFTQVLSGYSIVSLAYDKINPNYVYAGSSSTTLNGFFRSTDGGLTFNGPLNSINVWEILQKQHGTLFTLGTSSGFPVQQSTDYGLTWTTVGNTPAAIRGACLDLLENIYAAGNGGVYKSTNGGVSFSNFNLTFSSNKIISYQNKILVAVAGTTNGGIYIYTDQSIPVELKYFNAEFNSKYVVLKWSTATELNNKGFEIESCFFSDKSVNKYDWHTIGFVEGKGTTTEPQTYLFEDRITSSGKYYYRLKQIDLDGTFNYSDEIEVEVNLPEEFKLYQNYPNPFNPNTVISWYSPIDGIQTLKIYDVLGNEVSTLVNEFKPAGKSEYTLNVEDLGLSSGVYFYKLVVGDFTEIKKMILLQ